jgi:regulator of cell morphogenesis and NO signaling
MPFDAQTRIGDVVLEYPAAMRVFEALNIDYCCGGHRTLAEACAHASHALPEVLGRLELLPLAVPAPSDPGIWQERSLTDLITHIEARHGGHHPELARIAQCFQAMDSDLRPHLEKEERILFPFIRAMESGAPASGCFGTIQNPIRAMQNEHEQVGDILRELRTLTHDYTPPEDACGSFRSLFMGLRSLEEDLHLHIYLESHLLFPRAVALEAVAVEG